MQTSCDVLKHIYLHLLYILKISVIVGSSFNSIELTRPILILGLGKFPSSIEWDERRMRVKCSIQSI